MRLTKSKVIQKAASLLLSVMLVMSLAPTQAWAAASNGIGAYGTQKFFGNEDGTSASAAAKVTGLAINTKFNFVEGIKVPGTNYATVNALKTAIETNPLEAYFNPDGLPKNFSVTWYVAKLVHDDKTDKDVVDGEPAVISDTTYTNKKDDKGQSPGVTNIGDVSAPTFMCPVDKSTPLTFPSFVSAEGDYEFSCSISNTDLANDDINKTASVRTVISIYQNYKTQYVAATDQPAASVNGAIFVQGPTLLPPSPGVVPQLAAAKVTSGNTLQSLANLANSARPAEDVLEATQLTLNFEDPLPTGKDPYTGTLQVTIPVPSSLTVTEGTTGALAGKPTINGADNKPTDKVNVYAFIPTPAPGAASKKTATLEWAKDPQTPYVNGQPNYLYVDDDGNKVENPSQGHRIPVAVFDVSGTGQVLGTFGVGTPLGKTCNATITTGTDEMSLVNPSGEIALPLGSAKTISAFSLVAGRVLTGWEMTVEGNSVAPKATDIGLNTFTITPLDYGINENEAVVIKPIFAEASSEGTVSHKFTVEVASINGGKGTVKFNSTTAAQNTDQYVSTPTGTVSENPSNFVTVPPTAGITVELTPGSNSVIESIKYKYGPNKEDVSPVGLSSDESRNFMIGAITQDTRIIVTFTDGTAETITPLKVTVGIPRTIANNQPATVGNNEQSKDYEVNPGSSLTVNTKNNPDYDLDTVTITNAAGEKKSFPKKSTTTSADYTYSSFTIYNITENLTVSIKFKIADGFIEENHGAEGDAGWTPPETVIQKTRMEMRSQSLSALAGDDLGIVKNEEIKLQEHQRTQLRIRPMSGYTIGEVKINGDNVTNMLTKRNYFSARGLDLYTLTVYRGEPIAGEDLGLEFDPDNSGPLPSDGIKDSVVLYITSTTITSVITYVPVVIPASSFYTVTTSVTTYGHGAITPTRRVPSGKNAIINLFPENGYKVDVVKVNGSVLGDPSSDDRWVQNSNRLQIQLNNISTDMTVEASFVPGQQEGGNKTKLQMAVTAGAGGSIWPRGNYEIYSGSTETLAVVPATGYEVSTFEINGVDKLAALRNTRNLVFTTDPINKNTNVSVTFKRISVAGAATVTVTPVVKSGKGTISPASALTVGAGASANFTILPEYNSTEKYFIKDIRAKYFSSGASAVGLPLMGLLTENFSLTLPDIQEDVSIEVYFDKANDDGTHPGTTQQVPNPSDAKKVSLNADAIEVTPAANPGAVVTPGASELVMIEESDGVGVKGKISFTVNVAAGYELVSPVISESLNSGGIEVSNNNASGTKQLINSQCSIVRVSDGVFTVTVPGKLVTDSFHMKVNTKPIKTTAEEVKLWTIDVKATGNGKITPEGTDNKVLVENGRNQTFNFIPDAGHKLHSVYVGGKLVKPANNVYTVANIRANMKVEAVFAALGEGEKDQRPTTHNVVIVDNGLGYGTYSPTGTTEKPIQVINGANLTISTHPKNTADTTYIASAEYTQAGNTQRIPLKRVGNSFEIQNITGNINVQITWAIDTEQLYRKMTVLSSGPGTTSPMGMNLVPDKSTQIISVKPDAGKFLQYLKVNSANQSAQVNPTTYTYTLTNISADTTIEVKYCDNSSQSDVPSPGIGGDTSATFFDVKATVVGGKGGIVTPASRQVKSGASATFNIMPSPGFSLKVLTDNGTDFTSAAKGGVYQISNVTAAHAISVEFISDTASTVEAWYKVIASVTDNTSLPNNGGTISPAGATFVSGGGSYTLTIMPEIGCRVAPNGLSIEGVPTSFTGTSYTLFNVTRDTHINITFEKIPNGQQGSSTMTHEIEASSSVNGKISPSGKTKVANGKNAAYTFIPDEGYMLSYLKIDDTEVPAELIANNQYIFIGVTENHKIEAIFRQISPMTFHTITATAGPNGAVSPDGSIVVQDGGTRTITVAPFLGYKASMLTLNAEGGETKSISINDKNDDTKTGTIGSTNFSWTKPTLTLTNVTGDVLISAAFVSTGQGGTGPTAAEYTHVQGEVVADPPGSGAGGTISLPASGYTQNPVSWTSATAEEKNPVVSIAPNENSTIKEVVIEYGDGSKVEFSETANTINAVRNNGCVSYDAEKAATTRGVKVTAKMRLMTAADSGLPRADYYEVNITTAGGGTAVPSGRQKVASGHTLAIQLLPQSGYEVATLVQDGVNMLPAITEGTLANTSRKLVVTADKNINVDATFGFVNTSEYRTVTASVVGDTGGSVSPGSIQVANGGAATVHFFPAEGMKVSSLTVTPKANDLSTKGISGPYSLPSYSINGIYSDVVVAVTFAPIGEGEHSWVTPELLDLNASVADGNGEITPATQKVAINTSGTVYFKPKHGYQIDYVIFNDVVTTLNGNPAAFNATPVKGKTNELLAYFKPMTSKEQTYVKVAPVFEGAANGTISPGMQTVKTGDSTQFYVYPSSGYTIENVTVNGWPVADANIKPAIKGTAAANTAYNAYVVTLTDVQADGNSGAANVRVKMKAKPGNWAWVDAKTHKLTISGTNAAMLSPLGIMNLPEGMIQRINIAGITGHYLESVTATQYLGAQPVGKPIDLYTKVKNGAIDFEMGAYDTVIDVTYTPVGESKVRKVKVSLGKTQFDPGAGGALVDLDQSKVLVGGAFDGAGKISAYKVTPEGYLSEDGTEPLEFVGGGSYTFFASATNAAGKECVLKAATYDGAALNVGASDSTIYNAVLNGSADLDLVFRELRDDEQRPGLEYFNVWVEVSGAGGSATPANSSVALGGTSNPFLIEPADGYMIEDVSLQYYSDAAGTTPAPGYEDPDNNALARVYDVDEREYFDESYKVSSVFTHTKIVVTFTPCTSIEVDWTQDLGFLTPNPGKGKKLKVPTTMTGVDKLPVIVAPYEGNYLESFKVKDVTQENADDMTLELEQTELAYDTVYNLGDVFGEKFNDTSIKDDNIGENPDYFNPTKKKDEGTVGGPTTGDSSSAAGSSDASSAASSSDSSSASSMSAKAYADTNLTVEKLNARSGSTPLKTKFQNAYSMLVPIDTTESMTAQFATLQSAQNITITVDVGPHGKVDPSGTFTVPYGSTQTFNLFPDVGYVVDDIRINGALPAKNWWEPGVNNTVTLRLPAVKEDTTVKVQFAPPTQGNPFTRYVKIAAGLAKTGDLTGPAIAFFLLLVLAGAGMMVLSSVSRKRRMAAAMAGAAAAVGSVRMPMGPGAAGRAQRPGAGYDPMGAASADQSTMMPMSSTTTSMYMAGDAAAMAVYEAEEELAFDAEADAEELIASELAVEELAVDELAVDELVAQELAVEEFANDLESEMADVNFDMTALDVSDIENDIIEFSIYEEDDADNDDEQ